MNPGNVNFLLSAKEQHQLSSGVLACGHAGWWPATVKKLQNTAALFLGDRTLLLDTEVTAATSF